MSDLEQMASLLARHNVIDEEIADLTNRPAIRGPVGEWIAHKIFRVKLENSRSKRCIDGCFTDGPLAGKTVNVKWYGKREGCSTSIQPASQPASQPAWDYYLVMTGPKAPAVDSRGPDPAVGDHGGVPVRCAGAGRAVQEAETQTWRRRLRAETRVGGGEGLSGGGGQRATDANRCAARGAEAVR